MKSVPASAARAALLLLSTLGLVALIACGGGAGAAEDAVANVPADGGFPLVGLADVEQALETASVVLVDSRLPMQYELGHIPGAINMPVTDERVDRAVREHGLRKRSVIVYCSSARCDAAEITAERLRRAGCQDVAIYPDGWEGWTTGTDR